MPIEQRQRTACFLNRYGNIDSLIVEESGDWFIIAACVLHCLTRKSFQEFCQFPEFAFGVSYLKR